MGFLYESGPPWHLVSSNALNFDAVIPDRKASMLSLGTTDGIGHTLIPGRLAQTQSDLGPAAQLFLHSFLFGQVQNEGKEKIAVEDCRV
jgi:hypothetical protein